jgi:hypothetical protein
MSNQITADEIAEMNRLHHEMEITLDSLIYEISMASENVYEPALEIFRKNFEPILGSDFPAAINRIHEARKQKFFGA